MTRPKIAARLFAATSAISFLVAFVPVLKDGGPNVVFLGSGVVFLILAIASARKSGAEDDTPPA